MPIVGVLVGLVLFTLWRAGHRRRRRAEAQALQLTHRPLNEFDARFPADRRLEAGSRRRSRRRGAVGF